MSFYDDMAAVVTDLLTQFGGDITLKRPIAGAPDPVTGTGTYSYIDVGTIGISKPYPNKMIDGETIFATDKMVVLVPGVIPLESDKVLIETKLWPIVDIVTVKPADTVLAYFVQARR